MELNGYNWQPKPTIRTGMQQSNLRVSRQNNYCCVQWCKHGVPTPNNSIFPHFSNSSQVPQCLQHKMEWPRTRKNKGIEFPGGLYFCREHPNETSWAWHPRTQLAPHSHDTSGDQQWCWRETRNGGRAGQRKQHSMKLQECEMKLHFRIVGRACFMTVIFTKISMMTKIK